jgi:hypothetical protein
MRTNELVLERKLAKALEQNKDYKEKISELCKSEAYYKKEVDRLRSSRDFWKSKNKACKTQNKALRKKNAILLSGVGEVARHGYSLELMRMSVILRVIVGLSYGQIVRCLSCFQDLDWVEKGSLPCANTIQNWVSKMGLHSLLHPEVSAYAEGEVGVIIDESIQIGQEKLLLVLYAPVNKEKDVPLRYADVQVAYMEGRTSWTGAAIAEQIKAQLNKDSLRAVYVLSDEESALCKAVRDMELPHLPDIGHLIATCLRQVFEKEESYQSYIKLIGQYQSKGVNQALSYTIPASQRTKARFMNQHIHVQWAQTLLAQYPTLDEKTQIFYKDLPLHKALIDVLAQCLNFAETLALDIKNKGISEQYVAEKRAEISLLLPKSPELKPEPEPQAQPVSEQQTQTISTDGADTPTTPPEETQSERYFRCFLEKIDKYLEKYQLVLKDKPDAKYHASSDVIESLFGKYKAIRNDNKWAGMTDTVLEIPLQRFSLQDIQDKLKQCLEATFVSDIKQWKDTHTIENQNIKRIKLFKKPKKIKTN